jgi:hypothetical protein
MKLETHRLILGTEQSLDESRRSRIPGTFTHAGIPAGFPGLVSGKAVTLRPAVLSAAGRTWLESPDQGYKPLKHGWQGGRDGRNQGGNRRVTQGESGQPAQPAFPFPVLEGIPLVKGIETRSGMGVDAKIGNSFPAKIIQAEDEYAMFEYIRRVPRVKGMTVTEHTL